LSCAASVIGAVVPHSRHHIAIIYVGFILKVILSGKILYTKVMDFSRYVRR
jgi:hypothetical protein